VVALCLRGAEQTAKVALLLSGTMAVRESCMVQSPSNVKGLASYGTYIG
jgi:hypothetical protein